MTEKKKTMAIVLAAGQGTRMKGSLPKVLHAIAGKPMVAWTVEAALHAGCDRVVVVVGHGREQVEQVLSQRFDSPRVVTAIQPTQRGTGDAVRCALPHLEGFEDTVFVLHGDCPLMPPEALKALLRARAAHDNLAMLTSYLPDPSGYGRILRDGRGEVVGVREHRDCIEAELAIEEVNPAVYAIEAAFLRETIDKLSAHGNSGEIYLTDVVGEAALGEGVTAIAWPMEDLRGVNDRYELALSASIMRDRINRAHAEEGVTIRDTASTWIDGDVRIQPDVVIEPNVTLRGLCVVAKGATIDVGCVLTDVVIGPGARLNPYTVAAKSQIGEQATTGPFAHLRPDTELGPETKVGNFVETKKTRMGRGAKANHLSYLGDGEIGEGANVGCGVIFCNYDGVQKHDTVIEDGVFVGSDCQLVAPVRVGRNAYVATGTTVTLDVPEDALAIGRVKQQNKLGYAPRLRARQRAAQKK